MSDLLTLFADNLLPIFLVAGVGYLGGKWLKLEARSLSRVVFYLFSPCLIFDLLVSSQMSNGDLLRMFGFTVASVAVVGLLTWLLGRMLKLEHKLLMAALICTVSINAGNYGLSLNLFAFGEEALAHASLFFITSAILTYTVGVVIASMGKSSFADSLKGLAKLPTIYAAVLALIFIYTDLQLPLALERSVSLLSDAAIPGMLIVLGLQLQGSRRIFAWRALSLANGMRLLGGLAVGLAMAGLFGLQGMAYNAAILESSMPCPLTLTPLLLFLGA